MPASSDFVEALLAAPVGVAWLGLLEGEARDDVEPYQIPTASRHDAVAAAVDAVHASSFGSVMSSAVNAGYLQVGPWISTAAITAAAAYRAASRRRPIAEAIHERFGDELHAPTDVDAQEWWHSGSPAEGFMSAPRFRSFGWVYGAGQFTWAGVWTATRPPPEVHNELAAGWEIEPPPVSRWRLPVRPGARLLELHRPEDWSALVQEHPTPARPGEESWELPGANQDNRSLRELMSVPHQRAARTSIPRHLVPDWAQVAQRYDGIHLSWAGFVTSEGFINDLGDGDVAMLRYWMSERTLWLADVFGEPEPLDAPSFDTDGTSLEGVDVRADTARRRGDEAVLRRQLGR